jgi:hypothetical protein
MVLLAALRRCCSASLPNVILECWTSPLPSLEMIAGFILHTNQSLSDWHAVVEAWALKKSDERIEPILRKRAQCTFQLFWGRWMDPSHLLQRKAVNRVLKHRSVLWDIQCRVVEVLPLPYRPPWHTHLGLIDIFNPSLQMDSEVIKATTAVNDCCCHIAVTTRSVPLEKVQDVALSSDCVHTCFGLQRVGAYTLACTRYWQ